MGGILRSEKNETQYTVAFLFKAIGFLAYNLPFRLDLYLFVTKQC
jgi:hypothetical protein